jgi:hypothetical protein
MFTNLFLFPSFSLVVAAPKNALQKTGNLSTVLTAFQNDGVRVDISAQGNK